MIRNAWSKNITISAVLKAEVECPHCGHIHNYQVNLRPDPDVPDSTSMIYEDHATLQPCPGCQTYLMYHVEVGLRLWARIHEERYQRPEEKKKGFEQLDLFEE